jgi:hypothetical protein
MLQRSLFAAAIGGTLLTATISLPDETRLPAESQAPATAASDAATVDGPVSSAAARLDLDGDWLMTLPAGFQYRVALQRTDDGRYRLASLGNSAGVYERRGDKLYMFAPDDERHDVFTWRILNANTLLLIDETGASGARYAGATLCRQIPADTELGRTTPLPYPPESQLTHERWHNAHPSCFAGLPHGTPMELTGTAHNDAAQGAYVEGEQWVVFIRGLDAWPEQIELQTVTVSGGIAIETRSGIAGRQDVVVLQLSTYQLPDGPVQRVIRGRQE